MKDDTYSIGGDLSLLQDVIKVPLTSNSIVCLIEILEFAKKASAVMHDVVLSQNNLELAKSHIQTGENATQLIRIISKHLDIGEPPENSKLN